ncbi:hypothetical protein GBF38_001025 [Nibea albiflora]|uniref:Uncharacterized protein n=1 Tax=Nibea albiflora TaxID=240163 RepID=A0ACB7F080_NIBAL|nr:hypothetical protein GBF38_001025 [Nibea albiflora]
MSNRTLTTAALDERKAGVAPSCDGHNCKVQLVNGKAGHHDPVDIKRAHSSSNIQSKLDLTFRRCASLQRNGEVVAPPAHRILLSDKPSYATLQRTRYSTTSLGRRRPVAVDPSKSIDGQPCTEYSPLIKPITNSSQPYHTLTINQSSLRCPWTNLTPNSR